MNKKQIIQAYLDAQNERYLAWKTLHGNSSKAKKDSYRAEYLLAREDLLDMVLDEMEEECEWVEDNNYEYFSTSCGEQYCLIGGTLEDNNHNYCPYCGNIIKAKYAENDEDTGWLI